jgi:glycosyltransferase involved in cell wall biosynthesis
MKVLFITTWYPGKENPVPGIFVEELAKAVSIYDELIVMHGFENKESRGVYNVLTDVDEGFNVVRVPHKKLPLLSYVLYMISMFYAFKKIKKEFMPDIINAHSYKAGLIAYLIGKRYHIPIIVTEHTELTDPYRKGKKQMIKNALTLPMGRFVLNHADAVIAVSGSLRDYLMARGVRNRFEIAQNVVNSEVFKFIPRNREDNVKEVLFVGEISPRKGVGSLIEAFGIIARKRNDFVVNLVGYGSHEREYKKQVMERGLEAKVNFTGRKDKKEVAEIMQRSDFFVLPSPYEPFGVVLIEAMACGKPVIATSSGGPPEFVNKEMGLLVPPGNPKALAEAIEYMLDHCDEYDSEKISSTIKERFSYKSIGKQLHDIYSKYSEPKCLHLK